MSNETIFCRCERSEAISSHIWGLLRRFALRNDRHQCLIYL